MDSTWLTANQQALARAVARIGAALERHLGEREGDDTPAEAEPPDDAGRGVMSALEVLTAAFALSPFERDLLVLCAGVELDTRIRSLCAQAADRTGGGHPTFTLALAVLSEPHWSALSPDGPLRRWQLIELLDREEMVTSARLRIAERVLHYLAGVTCGEPALRGLVQPVAVEPALPPSQAAVADEIAQVLRASEAQGLPVVQLCGGGDGDKRAIAAAACANLGLHLAALRSGDLPTFASERMAIARLWEREAVLGGYTLLVEVQETDAPDALRVATSFVELLRGAVFVATREPLRIASRATVRIDVLRPQTEEQRELWCAALGAEATELNGQLESVLGHFDLSADAVHNVSAQALLTARDGRPLGSALWEACRVQTRPRLDGLAQRMEAGATWDDLVLPDAQRAILRDIAVQVRNRHRVYQSWGFAQKGARGLGISALFAGASGTGKTLAAEVLANELKLDLYRIDLSQVVSKYIGETEKNLRRVFDAAEGSGAILLFDEADALFGKRSEVKDSHDRFANIEISYLLQQMEAYRGLAILTSNLKSALDTAFLRRIRFIVQFPFPGAGERALIWRRIFPEATPTENLDSERLARLNVAGGNIRNIALNAAFLAAGEGTPVRMAHLLRAARGEYEKLERPLTDAETGGWV